VKASSSKKTDPDVGIVRLGVCAGGIEHAFDRIRRAGNVGPAFDRGKGWRDQNHQDGNDANGDEELDQRKSVECAAAETSRQLTLNYQLHSRRSLGKEESTINYQLSPINHPRAASAAL
jgi:hypothetical protein